MLTIILCWIAISAAIIFIGKLFIRNAEWYEYFWMGLIVVFTILQIWSIFLPVNVYALVAIFILAASSLLIFRKIKIQKLGIIKEWIVRNRMFLSIVGLALIAISYYASQSVGWDDTLLYHLNAVKWAKLYPVVRGLANLHSRLGFNSSFFLFASMLDNWFMSNKSSHLALSILVAMLSTEYIWIFIKSQNRLLKFFCLVTAPLIFLSVTNREIIASLSTDFALTLLVLATAIEFIKWEKTTILIAALLASVLITVKVSSIAFSIFAIIFIFLKRKDLRLWVIGGGALIIIPYLIRNIYLSGWLLYPLPMFNFNFDWAVPAGQVRDVYIVTETWAKSPGTGWTEFIGARFWQWFPHWYLGEQKSTEVIMFFFSAIILAASLLGGLFNKSSLKNKGQIISLCIISFASIVYLFFTAPDIRFGSVFFWLFFASIISLLLSFLKWNDNVKILTILLSVVFLFFVSWPMRFDTEPILKSVRWEQAWPTINVNGILKPTNQDFCGNSDLPCSPEDNKIKFRVPGDLSKGFAPVI